jgi:hypothetical protein
MGALVGLGVAGYLGFFVFSSASALRTELYLRLFGRYTQATIVAHRAVVDGDGDTVYALTVAFRTQSGRELRDVEVDGSVSEAFVERCGGKVTIRYDLRRPDWAEPAADRGDVVEPLGIMLVFGAGSLLFLVLAINALAGVLGATPPWR